MNATQTRALELISDLCKSDYNNQVAKAQRAYKNLLSLCDEHNADFNATLKSVARRLFNMSGGGVYSAMYLKFM